MKDFFFGEVAAAKDGAQISLSELTPLMKKVEPAFFTKQMNRLLTVTHQRITLTDGSSLPPFAALVRALTQDAVGFIEIYPRTDVNQSVEATLACDLFLDQGIVTVRPHWCAYKDLRASEVVSTLLLPIHLRGWDTRTFLRWEERDEQPLVSHHDYKQEVKDVFGLAKYPSVAIFDEDSRKRTERYAKDLEDASVIGTKGFDFDLAREELDQARKQDGRL